MTFLVHHLFRVLHFNQPNSRLRETSGGTDYRIGDFQKAGEEGKGDHRITLSGTPYILKHFSC